MIDIKELRIGNKVLHKDEIVEVVSISAIKYSFGVMDIVISAKNGLEMHNLKSLNPIQLTEEMLLKCGFKSIDSSSSESCEFDIFYNPVCDISLTRPYHWDHFHYESGITISNVHQLQNLVYALTCKELEVKF